MKKFLLGITLLLALLLCACNEDTPKGENASPPTEGVTMTATIKKMGEKIEVEVTKSDYTSGIHWVLTSNNTVFYNAKGEQIERADLQAGDSVEILYNGQVMMSLPPQIVALQITVL